MTDAIGRNDEGGRAMVLMMAMGLGRGQWRLSEETVVKEGPPACDGCNRRRGRTRGVVFDAGSRHG
jgi:hypothetical protein